MRFKSTESGDYHKDTQQLVELADRVHRDPRLRFRGPEAERWIQLRAERARVLERVERATGKRFGVATEVSKRGTAAFIDLRTGEAHMVESTLDNEAAAIHAGHHEKEHDRARVAGIPARETLSLPARIALEKALGEELLDEVLLMEAFNDWSTEVRHGKGPAGVGYKREIPQAQKLEELARKHELPSLLQLYREGKVDGMLKVIAAIAEAERTAGQQLRQVLLAA